MLRRPVDWHLRNTTPDMFLVGSDGSVPASRAILATASSWLSRSETLVQNHGPMISFCLRLIYEGKVSVSSGKIKDLENICAILGIRNVSREELPTKLVETARPEAMQDLTGQVVVAE